MTARDNFRIKQKDQLFVLNAKTVKERWPNCFREPHFICEAYP